jgi:hypothetical protein
VAGDNACAACGRTAGTVPDRARHGSHSWRAKPNTENDLAERATGITVAAERFPLAGWEDEAERDDIPRLVGAIRTQLPAAAGQRPHEITIKGRP